MLQRKKLLAYLIPAAGLTLIIVFVYYYAEKLVKIAAPFFAAIIIAYLLNPIVDKLSKKKISKSYSILIIYAAFAAMAVIIAVFILPKIINNTKDMASTIPDITLKFQGMLDKALARVQSSNWPPEVKAAIFRELQNGILIGQNYIMGILKKSLFTVVESVKAMFDVIVAMIIAYYLIKDAENLRRFALNMFPRSWRSGAEKLGRDINSILSGFIQGQLLTALIVGVLEAVGLYLVKVKYPLVLGLIGGIANIIPFFGPFIGAIPGIAVALTESPMKAVWAAGVFFVVQQIDNSFISPKIIEGRLGLHPVTTILVVLAGGEFFGIMGMLLAVPVFAIVKAVFKRIVEAVV